MGIPYIQAPGEAEAQCSEIVKGGLAYAVGSEDLDTLTFGCPLIMMRYLTVSEAKKASNCRVLFIQNFGGHATDNGSIH